MKAKLVSLNSEKVEFHLPEAYKVLQTEIRRIITLKLRRTNGTITESEFNTTFSNFKNLQNLKLRLFVSLATGELEWKEGIVTIDDLARKLGSADKLTPEIRRLFGKSKYLFYRTKYPCLVPSNRKDKIRGVYEEDGPIFGFDLLIRPIVAKFNSETGGKAQNDLTLGNNCFAIVLHTGMDKQGEIVFPPDVMFRYVSSEGTREVNLLSYLMGSSSFGLRQDVLRNLRNGNTEEAIDLLLNLANGAAGSTLKAVGP